MFYCRNQVQSQGNQRFDQPWTKAGRQHRATILEKINFVPENDPHKSQSQLEFDYSRLVKNLSIMGLYEDETQGYPKAKDTLANILK